MAERVSENQDLLREHWRSRRARVLGELRGMDADLEVLPNNPGGEEVRVIIKQRFSGEIIDPKDRPRWPGGK